MSHLDPHAPHAQPTAVYQAVPADLGPVAPAAPAPRRSRAALFVGLGVVALFALLAGAFLVGRAGTSTTLAQASPASATSGGAGTTVKNAPAGDGTTVVEAPTTAVEAPTTSGAGNGNGTGNGTGTGAGTKTGGQATPAPKPAPQAPTTAPAPSAPAPTITSFVTPENIDCHNNDNPMFSASWTTTNAVKTTIAIDGPGLYKTYGPNGSDSLPFNCSSPHTFKLTAFGQDGKTVSKTITLQPRNVRPPATPDTDQ